jgi:hypothetical protein
MNPEFPSINSDDLQLPSPNRIKISMHKPTEEVRRLFDKKMYHQTVDNGIHS